MKFKNSFYLFNIIGCLVLSSPNSYAMDDDASVLKSHRVQLFSVSKTQGKKAAHDEFDRLAKKAPTIKSKAAYLLTEKDSSWIRGQLKCNSEAEANQLVKDLSAKITTGPMVVKPLTVTSGQTLPFESLERHSWK